MKSEKLEFPDKGINNALGGGFLPGTMVLIRGARGSGKTKFGLTFAAQGLAQEGARGIVLDLSVSGDEQRHAAYALEQSRWKIKPWNLDRQAVLKKWPTSKKVSSMTCLHVVSQDYEVESVDRSRLSFEEFETLNKRFDYRMDLVQPLVFFQRYYGSRRIVLDGLEPTDDPLGSAQQSLIRRIYTRVLQASSEDLGRELFREGYQSRISRIRKHSFPAREAVVLTLETSKKISLDELVKEPTVPGSLDALANTVILMGERDEGDRVEPYLYVAKHRGSYRDSRKLPILLSAKGVKIKDPSIDRKAFE